jgi:hypothetical protein
VERIRTEIDIKLKGSRDLLKFNEGVKKLTNSIEQSVKSINQFQKKNELVLKSVNNLNASLSATKRNFNNVQLGTDQARVAAEQYLRSLRDTNAALAEQKAAVISLQNARRSEAAFLAQGARAGRSNANAEAESQARSVAIARARNLELQRDSFNQTEGDRQLQQALLALEEKSAKVLNEKLRTRKLLNAETAKAVNAIKFTALNSSVLGAEPLDSKLLLPAFQERGLNQFSTSEMNYYDSLNDKLSTKSRFEQKSIEAAKLDNKYKTDGKNILTGTVSLETKRLTLLRNQFMESSKMQKLMAVMNNKRFKGAASSALIGGGFPLLFGQGPAAAIGGGLGGLAGGMIGGGFGFALSIVGTAIGQAVAESNKFNKSLTTLNNRLQAVGGTSRITARDIKEIRKAIGGTKDETLQLVSSLSRFGPGATDIAKSLGPDASNIITTLASINQEELSTEKALQKLTSTIGNEKALQLASELKGLSVEEKRLKILKQIQLIEAKGNLSDREFKAFTGQLRGGKSTQSLLKSAKGKVGFLSTIPLERFVSQEADVLGLTNKTDKPTVNTSKQDLAVLQTRIALIKQGGTLLDEERQKLEQQLILDTRALEIAQANENQDKIRLANKKAFTSLATLDAQVAAAQTEEDKRRNEIITNTMEKLEGESQFLEESLSLGVEKAEIEKQIRDIVAIVGDEREGEVRSLVEGNAAQREKLQLLAEEKAMQQQIQGILAGGMTNAVMGLIDGTRTLGQALADVAKQLASMFLNRAFMKIFGNILGGGFIAPDAGDAMDGGGFLPLQAQGAYNRVGGFKAFQYGGVVNSPTLGMIGEGGEPEYVIPASKMAGAMSRYSAGARGGAVIPGGSHESGTVAGSSGNTVVEYTGPTLNFNGDEYVPKAAVPEIIGAAAKRGAQAGKAQVIGSLKNSRSQRASLGL